MKIILFSRKSITLRIEDIEAIFGAIERYGFEYAINREFAENIEILTSRKIASENIYYDKVGAQPEGTVMVCYGSDGTLLEGVHRLDGEDIPVVGINGGHLGFLALAPREKIKDVFEGIASQNLNLEQRDLLCIEGLSNDKLYALNEVAVQRLGASMISIDAAIDGNPVATYNGDGVILSTPTGSTAYSLSAGGPVVAPECGCFLLTPLAPHNFGMRPVVIPDTAEIVLSVHSRHGKAMLSIDNRTYRLGDGEKITLRKACEKILLVQPHNISFYETLHCKMMWDVDIRN